MVETVREDQRRDKKKSIFALLSDVPTLVRDLVKGELELLKTEIVAKLKILGVGAGLILGAVIVLFFFIGVLLTAAILGLATIMPGWLAVVLLIAIAILAWIGYREIKKAMPPVPETTIKNLKRDINAIRGVGKRTQV
jgi:membrane protein implicated in regulation of membrane protease activity